MRSKQPAAHSLLFRTKLAFLREPVPWRRRETVMTTPMTPPAVFTASFPTMRRSEASATITPITSPEPSQHAKLRARIQDGFIAVVIALLAQLLIAGIQLGLDQESSDFPAPILAMAAVFLAFSVGGVIIPGLEEFYIQRLKRPVSGISTPTFLGNDSDQGRRSS